MGMTSKPVLAWGIKGKRGGLSLSRVFRYKDQAEYYAGFAKDAVCRVKITEVKKKRGVR